MTERPSAAELWPVLSEGVRDKLLAYGHKHWQQVYEDVALQNQNWIPLRSPVATRAGYDEMNRITQRVSQLVLDACRRRARTAGELRVGPVLQASLKRTVDDAARWGAYWMPTA